MRDDVGGDGVNGLLVLLLEFHQRVAQGGFVEWCAGLRGSIASSRPQIFPAQLPVVQRQVCWWLFGDDIGIAGVQQIPCEGRPATFRQSVPEFLRVFVGQLPFQPGQSAGECGEGVFVAFAEGDAKQEFVELDGGLFLQRTGIGLVALAHAHGVHDDEVGFRPRVRAAHGLQIGGVSTRVPRPFICSK